MRIDGSRYRLRPCRPRSCVVVCIVVNYNAEILKFLEENINRENPDTIERALWMFEKAKTGCTSCVSVYKRSNCLAELRDPMYFCSSSGLTFCFGYQYFHCENPPNQRSLINVWSRGDAGWQSVDSWVWDRILSRAIQHKRLRMCKKYYSMRAY